MAERGVGVVGIHPACRGCWYMVHVVCRGSDPKCNIYTEWVREHMEDEDDGEERL